MFQNNLKNYKNSSKMQQRKNFIIVCMIFMLIDVCSSTNYNKQINKTSSSPSQQDNFLIIDHLNDNEKETRLKWKDLMGKETTLDAGDSERFVNR